MVLLHGYSRRNVTFIAKFALDNVDGKNWHDSEYHLYIQQQYFKFIVGCKH